MVGLDRSWGAAGHAGACRLVQLRNAGWCATHFREKGIKRKVVSSIEPSVATVRRFERGRALNPMLIGESSSSFSGESVDGRSRATAIDSGPSCKSIASELGGLRLFASGPQLGHRGGWEANIFRA